MQACSSMSSILCLNMVTINVPVKLISFAKHLNFYKVLFWSDILVAPAMLAS